MVKILSIVGARPNFIKMCSLIDALEKSNHENILVHTGQHYDFNMSDVFFQEMNIKLPDYNLGVGSGTHGYQTSEIMKKVEEILIKEKPDLVIVPGDTNSTIGAALAVSKMNNIKLCHLEAGLRSYDKTMPEEINRILTDHCSNILLCPTKNAVENLLKENIKEDVYFVGDTMYELAMIAKPMIDKVSLDINLPNEFVLSTIHRANNTNFNLPEIIDELLKIDLPVIIPLHPRTKKQLADLDLLEKIENKLIIINPLGYLEFAKILKKAKIVITDSGGIQKEAYWYKVPCLTVRNNTEWIETIQAGGNFLIKPEEISEKLKELLTKKIIFDSSLYGFTDTSKRIVKILQEIIEI